MGTPQIPLPGGIWPSPNTWWIWLTWVCPERHVDQFCHFCRAHSCVRQTDTQRDHHSSVSVHSVHAMWPNNVRNITWSNMQNIKSISNLVCWNMLGHMTVTVTVKFSRNDGQNAKNEGCTQCCLLATVVQGITVSTIWCDESWKIRKVYFVDFLSSPKSSDPFSRFVTSTLLYIFVILHYRETICIACKRTTLSLICKSI